MFYAAAVAVQGFSASRSLSYSLIFFFNLSQVYVGGEKTQTSFDFHYALCQPPHTKFLLLLSEPHAPCFILVM